MYTFSVGEERSREDADRGVARCVELMSEGRWVPGASHQSVADEFGVSPATVKNWATNASRILRFILSKDDVDEARVTLMTTLSRVISEGFARTITLMPRVKDMDPEQVPAPDLKAVVAACEAQARLLGLVTHKHDVRTRPAVAHLSRKEHLEQLEQLAREIADEARRIEEEGANE